MSVSAPRSKNYLRVGPHYTGACKQSRAGMAETRTHERRISSSISVGAGSVTFGAVMRVRWEQEDGHLLSISVSKLRAIQSFVKWSAGSITSRTGVLA
jgi:hypothetical protein